MYNFRANPRCRRLSTARAPLEHSSSTASAQLEHRFSNNVVDALGGCLSLDPRKAAQCCRVPVCSCAWQLREDMKMVIFCDSSSEAPERSAARQGFLLVFEEYRSWREAGWTKTAERPVCSGGTLPT